MIKRAICLLQAISSHRPATLTPLERRANYAAPIGASQALEGPGLKPRPTTPFLGPQPLSPSPSAFITQAQNRREPLQAPQAFWSQPSQHRRKPSETLPCTSPSTRTRYSRILITPQLFFIVLPSYFSSSFSIRLLQKLYLPTLHSQNGS